MKKIYAIFIIGFVVFGTAFTSVISPKWVAEYTSRYDDDVYEFVDYWYNTISLQRFEEVKGIEQEVILSKLWLETHGGHRGAGRRGALFGIKRKKGSTRKSIKGYDNVDDESVDYAGYSAGWESISHFCDFIKKPLYQTRFEAWQKVLPDYPEWHLRLLSLQVHPDRSKSRLAYAAVGCKDGTTAKCYAKRKAHADKAIEFVIKYLRIENDKWEGVADVVEASAEDEFIIGPMPPAGY